MYVIEDEIHAEVCGEFSDFEGAVVELKSRARIQWDSPPNRCPCQSWTTCGREYAIVEYDDTQTPWTQLSRKTMLSVSRSGAVWHQQ